MGAATDHITAEQYFLRSRLGDRTQLIDGVMVVNEPRFLHGVVQLRIAMALGVWTDTRAGSPENSKQDLASAVIAVTPPVTLREPLGRMGLIVAVVGVLLIVAASARMIGLRRARNRLDESY